MSILKRLESRFGRWAIPNLTSIIIAGQVLLYFGRLVGAGRAGGGDPLTMMYLMPSKVLEGEVWRLLSFAFVPPSTNALFAVIGWMIFYLFGTTLENQWGTVRYNTYLWLGYFANVGAAFVAWGLGADIPASNAFLYGTVFLAFARLFPNFVIHAFFVLPIQIKWLALLMWIGYGVGLVRGDGMTRMLIVASVLNYLVFFGRDHWLDLKRASRRRAFQAKTQRAEKSVRHQCRVCGLDSNTSPKTLFRYCSKCDGQCCYCPEHIQDHEHVVGEPQESQLADSRHGS